MLALISALIGAGLATIGVFLFFSSRRTKRISSRRLQDELVSVVLLVTGGMLLLSTISLQEDHQNRFDPNALLANAPTATGRTLTFSGDEDHGRLPQASALVLGWGTPSDRDDAGDEAVQRFTERLQSLTSYTLKRYRPEMQITIGELTRDEYRRLRVDPERLYASCTSGQSDLVVAVGVGATELPNGYALWREPFYAAVDCSQHHMNRHRGRINERPGDSFPYELAVRDDLQSLLNEIAVAGE